ncbi:kinase-like protein [Microstroma glucosiphilum]|uniref:Kinase-like protein n=1 Tax=Pseudomicrostroma glucosiphilum TaxID=1684307 RepID=A0A316U3F6_9BASI|nr:kinase-like protein [Pseudomicrostroma glucosiphilum]PWN19829.1 kinase-like protein [Pseudomicrostroma glucosiphilum]
MSVATKMARVDPGQKRKFNGSDSSGSRFHQAQRSPQRKAKLQAASQQRTVKQVAKMSGIFTMEEDELYDAFQFGKKVGSGNWATVYEARVRSDGQIKAIKLVSRSPNGVTTEAARQRFEALKKEYRILRTIPSTVPWHVNIIRHDCFISTPATGCLVAPLHDEPMTVCLPLAMLRAYCLKLASALEWLHTYCICHNDVKLANIVVDRNLQDPIGEPILVDFGFATDHRPGGGTEFWTQDKMGTAEYLSPERAAGRLHDERLSDIWALGVSFFEMATGRTPFERPDEGPCNEESMGEYRRRIQDDEWYIDDDLPQDLVELCRLMVHKNPRLRLPLAEVSQHDFFRRESRDDPSDLENNRLHLEGRDESSDSFLNSSSGHSHSEQKDLPKTPSHLASKIAAGSLAFPGSPGLDFDDLSFEPELIDSRAPWGSSADVSLKSEDLHSYHGHQHNHTVPRKAPKLAVPIDIVSKRDKFVLCTPHSTATVKPTAAQTAPPLRFALQNVSSKVNLQQSSNVKVGFSPEKGTIKKISGTPRRQAMINEKQTRTPAFAAMPSLASM